MSTVCSTLSATNNDNYARSNSRIQSQQNEQIYIELFCDSLTNENLHSKKIEYYFDLPKVNKNAVNIIKEKSELYSSLFQTKKSNIKNPYGICQKLSTKINMQFIVQFA